jgi:hypothetical protein
MGNGTINKGLRKPGILLLGPLLGLFPVRAIVQQVLSQSGQQRNSLW